MSESNVVTRFAPSPTGYLHVGGARTALFNWLLARHAQGKFLLRIEDTDIARSTEQACVQLLEDLEWLGLEWDNVELVFQSKRLPLYNRIIDDLIASGRAYEAFDSREELDAERREAEKAKRAFVYRKGPRNAQEIARLKSEGRQAVVRFAMPVKQWHFHDAVLGSNVTMPAEEAQDFVIRKADGMPTYHFAVVVDDAQMQISHVLRGQEHLKNTFYHIALQEELGYPRPIYGHLPIIMNLDGSKMGKRDRDKKVRAAAQQWMKSGNRTIEDLASNSGVSVETVAAWLKESTRQLDLANQSAVMLAVGLSDADLPEILVHDFRQNGYLPEVLLNFLALLGWSPKENRERLSVEEMVELFTIEGIGKSNAKFARDKLLAFNTEAGAAASPERLLSAMRRFLEVHPDSPLTSLDDASLMKLIQMKKGFRTLQEIDAAARFFFVPDDQIDYAPDAIDKVLLKNEGQGLAALRDIRPILSALVTWDYTSLDAAIKGYAEQKHLGVGKVAQPIRVAIAGNTVSPPIAESLEFLGRDKTLARITRCLDIAGSGKSPGPA